MSKNKLAWIFALIALIELPIAYAQNLTGTSQMILVLVNAAIVGTVLFVLQSFLITGKDGKEKTAVWIAIAVGSLVIAFLYGRTSFIWQGPLAGIFSIYVIVNATIIGLVFYFIAGILPGIKDKLGKEGSIGFGILIFLISVFFAVKLGNQWLWDQSSIRQLIAYLIGADGILNPDPPGYRLYTFLGGFFLLSFFFRSYLIKEVDGSKWINYGLAFLIASSMARSGYSLQSVIIMGELIFFLVLAQALDTAGTKTYNWLISFILVGWASAAATYGTEYQGLLATLAGWPLVKLGLIAAPATGAAAPSGWGWWLLALLGLAIFALPIGGAAAIGGKWGLLAALGVLALLVFLLPGIGLTFFIIAGLIVMALVWAMNRGAEKNKVLDAFKKRNFTRLWNELKTIGQRHASQVGVITKWDIPEGREPKSFVENRLLLFALLDYSLRIDIANSKRYLFDYKKRAKMNELWLSLGRYWNRKRLREEIRNYRSQVGGSTATFAYGWALFDKKILDSMEELAKLMYRSIFEVNRANPNLNAELTSIAQRMENINNELRTIAKGAETAYRNFEGRIEPYGVWHHIRSILINIYDMYNVYGKFEHDYIFPSANAKFRTNPYVAPDPANAAAIAALPRATPLLDPSQTSSESDIELNLFGFDVGRINRNQTKLRLLNPRVDSNFHPNLPSLAQWYSTEWKAFTEDFRKGTYSPSSRTVQDYSDSFSKARDVHMDDDSVAFKRQGGIAFDRRTLVDPGLWKYWGRYHYYGDVGDVAMESPYPRLTVLGIQTYLELLIRTRERDPETVISGFLDNYPMDLEKEVERPEDLIRAIGRWREKKAT